MTGPTTTGFAFATPACPLGLDRVSLWRLERDSQTPSLVDEGGAAVVTARASNRSCAAETNSGQSLRFRRDARG